MSGSAQTRTGRPPGDGDARRREIARATWQVIQEVGIDRASMRAIARAAGCTTGVLVHYFQDKDALLTFTISHVFEALLAAVQGFQDSDDVLEALRVLWQRGLPLDARTRLEWSVWLNFLSRAQHNTRFAAEIRARHGAFRESLEALIRRGQARGEIRTDVAAAVLTDQFNAQLDGLALMAPFEQKRFPKRYLMELMELAIDNLRSGNGKGKERK